MSFFGSKLFGLSSNGPSSIQSTNSSTISGAETIERLCERVQSSVLVEDRKDSLNAIKSLSKKYKLEVGTQAMPILIDILKNNRMDSELCCLALDILFNVMNTSSSGGGSETGGVEDKIPADIPIQFSEMFVKDLENLTLLFDLIDEFDFQTRWSTLKLLNQLIVNLESQSQEKILQIPRGVSRLIDLLNDSREVIRNDAIVLLINLTKTNGNIQKIVAFESGFDKIMEIIESEGNILRGGVIVEDCLNLLINLLQTNHSNQSFFKEASFIKVICKYLDLNDDNRAAESADETASGSKLSDWSAQKCTNLSLFLKLIRCLVAPSNQQQIITDCQKAFSHFGLLHRLCAFLTLPGVPADLLSDAIKTVGDVIRGHAANQQLFSSVMMQTSPPTTLVTILLFSMINDKQSFQLRNSVLYCFESFLHKNEEKKREVIETLMPRDPASSSQQQSVMTSGQILCTGLFNLNDCTSNWLCAVALAHTIHGSSQLKSQLLNVALSTGSSSPNEVRSVSLIERCMMILIESKQASSSKTAGGGDLARLQTTVAILMLMSTWLAECPNAVNQFLAQQQNIPYLISQTSSGETDEKSLIIQGMCAFLLGLCLLFNSNQYEMYTIDKLKDIIKKRIGLEQFQHKLEFISQHEAYSKTLKLTAVSFKSLKPADLLFDYEFARLFKTYETLILNTLENNTSAPVIMNSQTQRDQSEFETQIAEYRKIIRELDSRVREAEHANQTLTHTCAQWQQSYYQLQQYQQQYHSSNVAVAAEQQESLSEKLRLQARISELEVKVNLLEEKCSEQEDELCKVQRDKGSLQETIINLQASSKINAASNDLEAQMKNLKQTNTQLVQEQESLLTLLSEMELKLRKYKRILKARGETVSEGDEDDDEDDDEEVNNYANEEKTRELENKPNGIRVFQQAEDQQIVQAQSNNPSFNSTETHKNNSTAFTSALNNFNYNTTNPINENNVTSDSSDQFSNLNTAATTLVTATTMTNPVNYIDSFSNAFDNRLSFQPGNNQPQTTAELQNYFK